MRVIYNAAVTVSRVLAVCALLGASGCLSTPPPPGSAPDGPSSNPDAGTTPDARTPPDAPADDKPDAIPEPDAAPPPDTCNGLGFDPSNIACADIPEPVGAFNFNGTVTINTDDLQCPDGIACAVVPQANGAPDVVVASVTELSLGADSALFVTGSRPVIVVAFESLQIAGDVVVEPPPEDLGELCDAGRGDQGARTTYDLGPGGGGGGFGEAGGSGGDGSPDGAPAGGDANGNEALSPLRGGCGGGDGGNSGQNDDVGAGGDGGNGGGALQLTARTIDIQGRLFAPGGGGQGPQQGFDFDDICDDAGGGGGGSGGAILIEGQSVTLASESVVAVNGGGGGGGCNGGGVDDSRNGQPGRGLGNGSGAENQNSNRGGDGAQGSTPAEDGFSEDAAGGSGGGGGGLGRIRINTADRGLINDGEISGVLSTGSLPR